MPEVKMLEDKGPWQSEIAKARNAGSKYPKQPEVNKGKSTGSDSGQESPTSVQLANKNKMAM